jgi:hypothetical protein
VTTTKLKIAFVIAIFAGSVAVPFALHHHAQSKLDEMNKALHQHSGQFERLTSENERLSNLVAQANSSQSLSKDQLGELLRLRSEAGWLRKQMNGIQKLREENRQLQTGLATTNQQMLKLPTETDEELSAEILEAMKNICRELPGAMQRYASDHTNQASDDFSKLRNYFPTSGGRKMVGLYTFQFVRDDGPTPGDALILCEELTRQRPDGTWARVYGFSDGRAVEATSDKDDFDAWEKEHMNSPPSNNQ